MVFLRPHIKLQKNDDIILVINFLEKNMNGLTPEEKRTAYQYALNGADFMFEPTSNLRNGIALGCPGSIGINEVMTAIILEGKPIRLDSEMVKKYCKGTLDRKNTWLFDNGNIRVVPAQLKQPEIVRTEEDKEFFKNTPEIKNVDGKLVVPETKKEENSNE